MPKSRFFRVAVEGATTDGRQIERKWIEDIAATYNRETYAARINMEHVRGITADPPFQAYGDVLAVKAEEIELQFDGKTEKRLALFAEIDALDPLVAMNRKGQKLFTSIEVSPNFANTGKAYLVGLAVTDSPASLGTEMLEFCAQQGEKSPLAHRKQDPANLFTAALETSIELVDDAPAAADPTGVFAAAKRFFDSFAAPKVEAPADPAPAAPESPAPAAPDAAFTQLAGLVGQLVTTVQVFTGETRDAQAALRADLEALSSEVKTKIEGTPAPGYTARPLATGGNAGARTDC